MKENKGLLLPYSVEELAKAIRTVISMPIEQLRIDVRQYLIPRLDFLGKERKNLFFLFEEQYIETEWKDMIGVHYINTSYKVSNTVMRVHLFMKDEITEKSYLGFFTLRTLDEPRFMLSYIYPNWKEIFEKTGDLYVMTFSKVVHILGKEIVFETYPLFAQDNACVSCSQASIISMSHYLHVKYDYRRIRISDINGAYRSGKTKTYPTNGLQPFQMLEVLSHYSIPVGYQVLGDETAADGLQEYVDYCIESAVPMLVGLLIEDDDGSINRHVVQVIGHINTFDHNRKYVVYDDSGYYLEKIKGKRGFVGSVTWEELKAGIKKGSFLIYPIHEKVYILYDVLKKQLQDMFSRTNMEKLLIRAEAELLGCRILIADNCDVKKFLQDLLLSQTISNQRILAEIQNVLYMDMPHYLWYCEYHTTIGNLLFLANPTYNSQTTKNIFINKAPIICESQMGLLTMGKKSRKTPV